MPVPPQRVVGRGQLVLPAPKDPVVDDRCGSVGVDGVGERV